MSRTYWKEGVEIGETNGTPDAKESLSVTLKLH